MLHRRGRRSRSRVVFSLAGATLLSISACRSGPAATKRAQRQGDAHLEQKDYAAAAASFEKAAALATSPEEKAKANLGAGLAALEAKDPSTALRYLYAARKAFHGGRIAGQTNHAIGQAYFDLGDYGLARRYLQKGLTERSGEERETALARLVICCRGLDDLDGAASYRGRLEQPLSPEVRGILATEPKSTSAIEAGPDDEEDLAPFTRSEDIAGSDDSMPKVKLGSSYSLPGGDSLHVIPRQSWSARAPRRNIEYMGKIERITVHHTGDDMSWGSSSADAAEEIRKIQQYHQNHQGWADIGYHYIIDRQGNIWQGRRIRYQGAHARGPGNLGNIGVVLLGNYLYQGVTAAQRRRLELLVTKLCDHFSIPPGQVYTHREIVRGKTDCPGPALTRCVREIRENLRRRLVAFKSR